MKNYISHISKIIFLTLILLILSFGMIVYAYYDYSKPIPEEPQFYCGVVDVQNNSIIDTPEKALGEQLFKNNCTTCHVATDEILVGPGLKGITQRRPIDWIVKWVNNPQKVIASGDKYAVDLFEKYNLTEMTPYPNFNREEIISIIVYIDNQ